MTHLSYDYYPKVLNVLELISQGQTETAACDEEHVSIVTFRSYIKNDATLQVAYEEAVQRGHDAMADALINIDNHKIHGHSDAKMAKVISDNIKWVLAKRDNKRFGDRIEVKHEITMDKAIVTALEAGKRRAASLPGPVIDLVAVEPISEDDAIMRDLMS